MARTQGSHASRFQSSRQHETPAEVYHRACISRLVKVPRDLPLAVCRQDQQLPVEARHQIPTQGPPHPRVSLLDKVLQALQQETSGPALCMGWPPSPIASVTKLADGSPPAASHPRLWLALHHQRPKHLHHTAHPPLYPVPPRTSKPILARHCPLQLS